MVPGVCWNRKASHLLQGGVSLAYRDQSNPLTSSRLHTRNLHPRQSLPPVQTDRTGRAWMLGARSSSILQRQAGEPSTSRGAVTGSQLFSLLFSQLSQRVPSLTLGRRFLHAIVSAELKLPLSLSTVGPVLQDLIFPSGPLARSCNLRVLGSLMDCMG